MKSEEVGACGTRGGVAQLGEHLPCKQGVMGSNPIISTKVGKRETDREARADANCALRIANCALLIAHCQDLSAKTYGLIAQLVRARA